MDPDAATRTMIENLPARTGRTLQEWFDVLDAQPHERHAPAVAFLKSGHGLSHGFANLIVTLHRSRDAAPVSSQDLVAAQYTGGKAKLLPIYERIVATVADFGDDVQIAPKKTGVSLRRRKQFALVEVPSATRVRLGLNLRDVPPTARLRAAGGMCTHGVDVRGPEEVDDELVGWLRSAYDRA